MGSANNAIVMQEPAKQRKANAIYRYEKCGYKLKLKLESINMPYSTANYLKRESESSTSINP